MPHVFLLGPSGYRTADVLEARPLTRRTEGFAAYLPGLPNSFCLSTGSFLRRSNEDANSDDSIRLSEDGIGMRFIEGLSLVVSELATGYVTCSETMWHNMSG